LVLEELKKKVLRYLIYTPQFELLRYWKVASFDIGLRDGSG
jgi:hypothetical protein